MMDAQLELTLAWSAEFLRKEMPEPGRRLYSSKGSCGFSTCECICMLVVLPVFCRACSAGQLLACHVNASSMWPSTMLNYK